MTEPDPRYPVGEFIRPAEPLSPAQRQEFLAVLAEAPNRLRQAVAGLTPAQLDTPYRPGGWTVRQVAHHIPDSHLNAYVRVKLALTEKEPAVQPYEEGEWAKLPDVAATPVEVSVALLDALHRRWVTLLRLLSARDFERTARHPSWGLVTVDFFLADYAWHSRHHVAHITSLRNREGWAA
ncbi:MAG TPA: putative metal-dependent hydrolase [Thermoanaerobaculia bacterium]|nr:putative metal-dependent hydrolase [Thermoanaerobaculia bacterium]